MRHGLGQHAPRACAPPAVRGSQMERDRRGERSLGLLRIHRAPGPVSGQRLKPVAMRYEHPSGAGPYERAVRQVMVEAAGSWWPDAERLLVLGGPPWLAARVAAEAGTALEARSGSNVVTTIDDLTIIGCPNLDGP